MVCIYAKEEHVPHIKRVQSQTAGVGVMGMMGNKGGAAIRLKFHDTTMCLVAAHLAAHRDNVAGRNADFANILQRVQFVHVSPTGILSDLAPGCVLIAAPFLALIQEVPTSAEREELGEIAKLIEVEETSSYTSDGAMGQLTFGIMDHELVFFIGDFNYRIVEGMPPPTCLPRTIIFLSNLYPILMVRFWWLRCSPPRPRPPPLRRYID